MQKEFTKNFIKGKIGEVIFDQMFRDEGRFTVIPFGYDRTLPELAQYAKEAEYQQVIDNIRSAPDFAIVSRDKKKVFLIEVKYRTKINIDELQEIARKIEDRWFLVWMFVCTPNGFYFDRAKNIIEKGKLTPLSKEWISMEIQQKYIDLIKYFITDHKDYSIETRKKENKNKITICPIHKIPMKKFLIYSFGMRYDASKVNELESKYNIIYSDGRDYSDGEKSATHVYICPKCIDQYGRDYPLKNDDDLYGESNHISLLNGVEKIIEQKYIYIIINGKLVNLLSDDVVLTLIN